MNIMAEKWKIGWIGTGVMGISMCSHIQAAGYPIYVYTRSKNKAQKIIDNGAIWCENPKEVAKQAEVIFSIVGYPQDVEEIYLGENGLLEGATEGKILIDMTTSEPNLAEKIYKLAKSKKIEVLDAPVSGGDIGAKNATLAIMVGGDREIFETVKPLFELMGKTISYMGKAGAGQHTKMANQIHIASTMIGVVECLLYAQKAGLDLDTMIDIVGSGAAASWSLNNLGRRIVKKNYDPGFFIKHFVKDMGIALAEAKRMRISLPGLALAHQFYIAAIGMGWENLGTHGLYKLLAHMNGIKIDE
jgi:3-hydroxyisobutyrate dehydrogenase